MLELRLLKYNLQKEIASLKAYTKNLPLSKLEEFGAQDAKIIMP